MQPENDALESVQMAAGLGCFRFMGGNAEASYDGHGTVWIRWGNLTAKFSGKTDDQVRIDPELAADYGRRIVANLGEM